MREFCLVIQQQHAAKAELHAAKAELHAL